MVSKVIGARRSSARDKGAARRVAAVAVAAVYFLRGAASMGSDRRWFPLDVLGCNRNVCDAARSCYLGRPLIAQCVVTRSIQMLTARGNVDNEGASALSDRCDIQEMTSIQQIHYCFGFYKRKMHNCSLRFKFTFFDAFLQCYLLAC